jgi:RNA 2',3'-cyclic 3'-phosphodiesterase
LQDPNSLQRQPKKRLFVAIGLPQELLEKLGKLQSEFKPFARDAKWVKPHGIHLTLKFLGYVDQALIPEIRSQLSKVTQTSKDFEIEVSGLGFFPNARRPSVLWVGVQSAELLELQRNVEESMSRLGFEKENRAFSPHLTLARFKSPKGLLPLAKAVEERKEKQLATFSAEHFELFESILHRDGAEYIIVESFPLRK